MLVSKYYLGPNIHEPFWIQHIFAYERVVIGFIIEFHK